MQIKTVIKMMEHLTQIRRQQVPFDLILKMLEGLKSAMGFSKLCFYPIDYNVVRITTEHLSRERKTRLHAVDFLDSNVG